MSGHEVVVQIRALCRPAHAGLRNALNNNAHDPTSGRSRHYWSGPPIRVVRDIGRIFSSLCPFHLTVSCFLVALIRSRDLLLRAKYLLLPPPSWKLSLPRAINRPFLASLEPRFDAEITYLEITNDGMGCGSVIQQACAVASSSLSFYLRPPRIKASRAPLEIASRCP